MSTTTIPAEPSEIVISIARDFADDKPLMMTQISALSTWVGDRARDREHALEIARTMLDLDEAHAKALADMAGLGLPEVTP